MGEQDMLRDEAFRVRQGAPPRDLSQYSRWREEMHQDTLQALDIYTAYSPGLGDGSGFGLNLASVVAALRIAEVPRREWEDMARWLYIIHAEVSEIMRRKAKRNKDRG